ncbi:MAG: protein-export membrane protein SecF [Acidobacteria bacterium 13_1_20CM_2_65_9]|nr:MAG: protein-export membrane protein SecF [Acidobacteria bacterium 13_1_20CM_2_65_9]
MHIFKNTNYDFLRWRWHAIALSWVIIIVGVLALAKNGIPKGVEFAGGTVVINEFDQAVSVQQVREALDRNFPQGGQNVVVQAYGDPSQHQVMIRVPSIGAEQGASLSIVAQQANDALKKSNLGNFRTVSTEIVGPTVGRELTTKAVLATVLSLVGILAYLAFRFQFSFGVGAVVATIHDLLITLAFLAFFRYDMTLNVIAALLTMTGYSTNDTIVIFDRIRENLRSMRRDSLNHVINVSVNQTLGRTVIGRRHHHRDVLERVHRGGDRQPVARHGADASRGACTHATLGAGRCGAAATPAEAAAEGSRFVSLKSEV